MPETGDPERDVDLVAKRTGLPRPAVLVLGQLHALALGCAAGIVCGTGLFAVTIALVLRGGEHVGRNLSLLRQYLAGYSVTASGALVGLIYGLLLGFVLGYSFARIRNALVRAYVYTVRRRAERHEMSDWLDRIA